MPNFQNTGNYPYTRIQKTFDWIPVKKDDVDNPRLKKKDIVTVVEPRLHKFLALPAIFPQQINFVYPRQKLFQLNYSFPEDFYFTTIDQYRGLIEDIIAGGCLCVKFREGSIEEQINVIPDGSIYQAAFPAKPNFPITLVIGQTYTYVQGNSTALKAVNSPETINPGIFLADTNNYILLGHAGDPVTAQILETVEVSNMVSRYKLFDHNEHIDWSYFTRYTNQKIRKNFCLEFYGDTLLPNEFLYNRGILQDIVLQTSSIYQPSHVEEESLVLTIDNTQVIVPFDITHVPQNNAIEAFLTN